MAYKFDDCVACRFRRRKTVCAECDYGEQFEDASIQPLNFDDSAMLLRANKSLVTEDDEPDMNPDDLIERLDAGDDGGGEEQELPEDTREEAPPRKTIRVRKRA